MEAPASADYLGGWIHACGGGASCCGGVCLGVITGHLRISSVAGGEDLFFLSLSSCRASTSATGTIKSKKQDGPLERRFLDPKSKFIVVSQFLPRHLKARFAKTSIVIENLHEWKIRETPRLARIWYYRYITVPSTWLRKNRPASGRSIKSTVSRDADYGHLLDRDLGRLTAVIAENPSGDKKHAVTNARASTESSAQNGFATKEPSSCRG